VTRRKCKLCKGTGYLDGDNVEWEVQLKELDSLDDGVLSDWERSFVGDIYDKFFNGPRKYPEPTDKQIAIVDRIWKERVRDA